MLNGEDRMSNKSDSLLVTFLNSASTTESENALADLFAEQVEPTINKTLRSKLHVSLKENDLSQSNQDTLEIASDVKLILVKELQQLKSNGKFIQNLNSFVASVTINAYRQYLRAKYPLRQQLKNKLRYLLSHHGQFALWENGQSKWICGLKEWSNRNNQSESPGADSLLASIEEIVQVRNLSDAVQTVDLLIAVFEIAKAPILFNELVSIVANVQGVKDQKQMTETEDAPSQLETIAAAPDETVAKIEQRQQLKKVWTEIGELPIRHRAALLLNLKDRKGDCLIWLFPLLRIASIKQIASMLEFPPEDFAAIWNELPWEDNKIAEYLNLTRQQVINLRQSARARLARLFAP